MNKYHTPLLVSSRHKINICLFPFFHSMLLRVLSFLMYTFASYMLYICFLHHVNRTYSHVNAWCASARDAFVQICTVNFEGLFG